MWPLLDIWIGKPKEEDVLLVRVGGRLSLRQSGAGMMLMLPPPLPPPPPPPPPPLDMTTLPNMYSGTAEAVE
jgi:hypothetical protein